MHRLTFILLLTLHLLASCKNQTQDLPQEQYLVHMALKRMRDHGRMEPVLEVGQAIDQWHFQATYDAPSQTLRLADGSAIRYRVVEQPKDLSILPTDRTAPVTVAGKITAVDRDLVAGTIQADVAVSTLVVTKDD